jgi:hypothetical protein
MIRELKSGDRVRVTIRNRRVAYEAGDKGTVLWAPTVSSTEQRFYLVSMDKDGPGHGVTFAPEQIEPDA